MNERAKGTELSTPAQPLQLPIWDTERTLAVTEPGSTTLLVFAHSKCHGCVQVAPELSRLADDYAPEEGVRLVSAVTDEDEALADFAPGLLRSVAPEAWELYGLTPTPTLLVIDGGGRIVYRGTGGAGLASIEELLGRASDGSETGAH